MSNIVIIAGVQSVRITYQDRPVCTTQQLAQFYGCDTDNILDNHRKNPDRFEEGKHFFILEGEALKLFKKGLPENIREPLKFAPKVILWTERGAARHAKMVTTDKAWDVFEQMEDSYFAAVKAQEPAIDGSERSTVLDRLQLYLFVAESVVRRRLPFGKVYSLVNWFADSADFKSMTKEQVSEVLGFCDRYATGRDTRNDWQRIADNHAKLHGKPPQVDFIQMLLLP